MSLTVLDIFSGIGGFSLGLESVGMRTIGFCEIEPFPRAVLAKHWPSVPIHDDVRTLSAESVSWLRAEAERGIDLICGGFPCQDISVAGKGAGLSGARSGLWSEYARLVGELRPRWVVAENVGALRTRGVDRVCSDLEAEGYSVWPLLVGAWAVGAPHRRERVWIVGHSQCWTGKGSGQLRMCDAEKAYRKAGVARIAGAIPQLGDTDPAGLEGHTRHESGATEGRGFAGGLAAASGVRWPARPGEPQHEWEPARLSQFSVGRNLDGLPERLVRAAERRARRANREALRAYGNSVVPQVVAAIGRAILEVEMTDEQTPAVTPCCGAGEQAGGRPGGLWVS